MESKINWDLITSLEGKGVKQAYVPDAEQSQSGVTVGSGFDLGSKNTEFLKELNLDTSLIDKLTPFLGLKGAQASESAPNLKLDDSEVNQIDTASKQWYTNKLIQAYNGADPKTKWEDLDEGKQTVLASVFFQYGDLKSKTPNFWNQVTTDDWDGALANLRNFGDRYNTRRNKEADFLETFLRSKKKIEPAKELENKINVAKPVEIKEELIALDKKFKPRIWKDGLPIDDGMLMPDRLYYNNEFRKFIAQEPTLPEEISAAFKEGTLIGNMWNMFTSRTFAPEEGFMSSQYETTDRGKEIINGYSLDNDSLIWLTERAVSPEHWEYLAERVAGIQRNRETLQRAGWSGIAWQIGSWLIDPINMTGYGLMNKGLKAIRMANRSDRLTNFAKSGALVAGTETALFSPVAYNQPTLGTDDVILATILGGTLGGGINVYLAKSLNNVSKAVTRLDVEENGGKLARSVVRDNPDIKNWIDTFGGNSRKIVEDIGNTADDLYDTSIVEGKSLLFPTARNAPFGFLIEMTKSGMAGKSLSPLMKKFGFTFMDDPIGWADDTVKGTKADKVIAQPETVDIVRETILMTVQNAVYPKVHEAFKAWTKINGGWVLGRFVNYPAKAKWDQSVKRAVVAMGRKSQGLPLSASELSLLADTNIMKAANAYADGFEWFAQKLKQYKIDGAENLEVFRGYVPRKASLERLEDLANRLGGEQYVEELLEKAIIGQRLDDLENQFFAGLSEGAVKGGNKVPVETQQPLLDELTKLQEKITKLNTKKPKKTGTKTFKTWEANLNKAQTRVDELNSKIKNGETVTTNIAPTKARVIAQAMVKMIKYNKRAGGFDLEKLIHLKDRSNIKQWIDDIFDEDLSVAAKKELEDALSQNFDVLTSGRFAQRVRLNENFEATINGVSVRLDDLYDNSIDNLWSSYVNEMSGWLALAEKTGINSREKLIKYKNTLKGDIDKAYINSKGLANKADAEKKTVDAVFNNIFGRSAEADPTSSLATSARWLRRYNFTRVLNQVGIAQLPEFGVATAQQGLRTLVNEIPAFRKLIDRNLENVPDTFLKDMAVIGASNGDEWLYRMFSAYEVTERGVVNPVTFAKTSQKSIVGKIQKNVEPAMDAMEKGTGFASGLLGIDSIQRKLAMRMFVHRFAEDLIDVGVGKISKSRLARYRVLGLSEDELTALGKEFNNNKNVISYKNYLGRRVMSFHWENFKDQALVRKFAIATNRYTRRAVQYNMIGDTSRIFSDTTLGKTFSQFRQFVMVAWNKQFLHNLAMADAQTASMFLYTTMIGGMGYYAHSHFNSLGMSTAEKRKYLKKKFGSNDEEFWIKMGLASFQRAGWSSMMPPLADMITQAVAPEYRFNTRSSGQEMNLITGNPSWDAGSKLLLSINSILKSTRSDYQFSKKDLNRIMRLLPFQNMYGINQFLNFVRDNSGLPDKGNYNPY